jgi:hypothetical protein
VQLVRFFHSHHSDATLLRKGESRIAKWKDKRKDSYRETALTVVKGRGNTLFDIQGAAKAKSPSGNDWLAIESRNPLITIDDCCFAFSPSSMLPKSTINTTLFHKP